MGMAGNLLDLPGSVVRDLLTWLPGGSAPVNPLDQFLSPLSSDNRTSGRDLLEGYGMRANRETGMGGWLSDPGEGVRDVAGFAADVLLDPLPYLTGGGSAIGKGGKVAKSPGLLDDLTRVAAKKAGWPDDREVWTGSCPCQPFSSAGAGLGDADPRNLWPAMFRLVR